MPHRRLKGDINVRKMTSLSCFVVPSLDKDDRSRMLPCMSQGDQLAAIREQLGMNQTEFARALKISRPHLSKLENSPGNLSPKLARRLSDLCHARGLSVGGGNGGFRVVPIRSWAQAGVGVDFDELPLDWQRNLPTDCPDERAFAVEIQGDSMEPKYSQGDVAVLMPSRQPRMGDLVVARLDPDGPIFKIFNSRSAPEGRMCIFSSYNPAYQPQEVSESAVRWNFPVYQVVRQVWR